MMKEKSVMKQRCAELGVGTGFFFWLAAVLSAANLVFWIWACLQPESSFSLSLSDTPSGFFGVAELAGIPEGFLSAAAPDRLEIATGILNEAAAQMPKYVFLADFACHIGMCAALTACLWYIRKIFKNIGKFETPFVKENSRAIFCLGIVVILVFAMKDAFAALAFARGIGGAAHDIINLGWFAPAIPLFCLSYIFEYGCALQQESDETL